MSLITDIEHLMLEAWDSLLPRLSKDPSALAARLARRRSAILSRPYRPYCLALRAADTRISPYRAIFDPEHAIRLDDPRHPYEYIEHTVTIDSALVRHVCQPYHIGKPGEPAWKLAPKLGVDYGRLSYPMKRGVFSINYVPLLGGRRGKPIPVLYVDRWLDPNGERYFEMPHPGFGCDPDAYPLHTRIGRDVTQTVRRIPHTRHHKGEPRFAGWRWACPACERPCKLIFFPLPPPMLDLESTLPPPLRRQLLDCDARQPGLPTFACARCHQLRRPPREHAVLWNVIVTLRSGGLLFGHEVEPPPAFSRAGDIPRKNKRSPHRNPLRAPETRAEILRLLTETTDNLSQIARALSLHHSSIKAHQKRLYRDHNVTTRADLKLAAAKRDAKANVA